MRIGIVCPYALDVPGGVQNQVLGLAAWLHSTGHEAFVIAPGRLRPHQLLHGLPAARVSSAGSTRAFAFNGSVARVAISPDVARRVRRWLDACRLDVLNIHEPLVPLVSWAALKLADVATVGTFHASGASQRAVRAVSALVGRRLRRLTDATAVSKTASTQLRQDLGVAAQIVPNGLFTADFAAADMPGWRGGAGPRIAFLGRLDEPRKGLDIFLQAGPLIRRTFPDAILTVAGAGESRLPAWIEATGRLSDTERNLLLKRTDVFVAPNTGRESFGLILVEALAAGAAVVGSDLSAFRDVLTRDGQPTGLLFPVFDAVSLASAVKDALRRTQAVASTDRQDLRSAGLIRARDFDWDQVGPQYLRIFFECLSARSSTSIGDASRTRLLGSGLNRVTWRDHRLG